MPPLEQRKKRGFCKYHNFLGHKTSQCFLFRDLVQKALEEGRLKFADKPAMKIDANPLQMDAHYAEPSGIHMVEVSEDFINKPVFGSFTGNIYRKTIEGVRKATEGLNLNKGAAQGSNKKATEGVKLNKGAAGGSSKRVTEDPNRNKGVTESSNRRTTTGSYVAAVKGST